MNKIIKNVNNNREKERYFMELDKGKREKQIEYGNAEVGEDATKYGEFISSYFAWVSLPQQKEKVEELENITKNDEKKRKL